MISLTEMDKHLLAKARKIAAEFVYEPEDVATEKGLASSGEAMAMTPTYITAAPTGTEKGIYLAADLGNTNLYVCSADLHGDRKLTSGFEKTRIPDALKIGTSKELFSFLAKRIEYFVKLLMRILNSDSHFQFPVQQVAINKGCLVRWTDGYNIPNAIGRDVCELLQIEIDALSLPIQVVAVVDNVVGTLMTQSYSSQTLLGANLWKNTNVAYFQKASRIGKLHNSSEDQGNRIMVVKSEAGAFDNDMRVLPNTSYDRITDRDSTNPGMQINAIVDLNRLGLFKARGASIDEYIPAFTPFKTMGVSSATTGDAMAIKVLVCAIGKRAARLAAIPIAATIVICIEGSVSEYYPEYEQWLRGPLRDIEPLVEGAAGLEDALRITFVMDAHGLGTAITASVV
ncbi:glucokinase [Trichoderma velutinum]